MTMYVYVNQILIMSVARSHPKLSPNVFVPRMGIYGKPLTKPNLHTVGIQVQGRLKWHIEYWEQELKVPDHIIESIWDGYVLPLFSAPSPYMGCNHKSAVEQK